MNNSNSRKMSFIITFSGLMIAISIVLKFFTQYVPIAGALVLRMDFYGPFEKMPAMIFGPLIGGIVGAVVDMLGFFFANKTMNGYIFVLTITAFLNCFVFGLVWKYSKNLLAKSIKNTYLIVCGVIFAYGGFNYFADKVKGLSKYNNLLGKLGETKNYLSVGLMVVGGVGIAIYCINWLICKYSNNNFLQNNYFRVFVSLIIPGLIFSIINTELLILFIPGLSDKAFMVFLIPRLVGQVIETFYEAYILCVLMSVSKPLFRNKGISL